MKEKRKNNILPVIILNARPGAGKSEIIKFLTELDPVLRKDNFHIGKLKIIDDFPFLWRWFEEDYLLEQMGKARLFTDSEGYFLHLHLWDLLIHMINLEYMKFIRDTQNNEDSTVIIEFSRGMQHGGYQRAYPILSNEILNNASLLYVDVSWEESLRKNRERFNPEKPDSILEHGLPDKKLEFMYSGCDFYEFIKGNNNNLEINGHIVPYTVFENEDDVTTDYCPELGKRLEICLNTIWKNFNAL